MGRASDSADAKLLETAVRFGTALGWYSSEAVEALFVVGSAARGDADALSDVDLVVVLDETPLATKEERHKAYWRIGCHDLMLGLFEEAAPALPANVLAIDKVRYQHCSVDVCFCRSAGMRVYDFQPIRVLHARGKSLPHRETTTEDIPVERIVARLHYDLRIARVHAERYARWTARRAWMEVDLSIFLKAVRDCLLIESGLWRYNENQTGLWGRAFASSALGQALRERVELLKTGDDRTRRDEKLRVMEQLLAELQNMLNARSSADVRGGDHD